MIIGLFGKQATGKSTVAELMKEYIYEFWDINLMEDKFAFPLKIAVAAMLGRHPEDLNHREFKDSKLPDFWKKPGEKKAPTVREFMEEFATNGIRKNLGEDAYVNAFKSRWDLDQDYVISDGRFKNEADFIRQSGGFIIHIGRTTKYETSLAESEIDDIVADYTIDNNGDLFELKRSVLSILNDMFNEKI